ncbi:unnamed protein product [Discula destructiva]
MLRVLVRTLIASSHGVLAAPRPRIVEERHTDDRQVGPAQNPNVTITNPAAIIMGRASVYKDTEPVNLGVVETFNQIPVAKAPVGPLRLKPPVPLDPNGDMGTIDATVSYAKSCPQQIAYANLDIPGVPETVTSALEMVLKSPMFQNNIVNADEDCLTIDVQRPGGTTAGDNLPVLLWIFGGGFELGNTAMYDASHIVEKSVELGKPVIFAAVNYRVAGFGFLGGKEILADGSANLGLLDQRLGMQWVQDHIRDFGGDPNKVTLWGESAGAISIFDHMVAYNGNHTGATGQPLFHGAIMNSGSAVPADPVDCRKAQAIYDSVVATAGCAIPATAGAADHDTLACLRSVPYATFLNASNSVPSLLSRSSLALSYLPRPDGTFLTASPDELAGSGSGSNTPTGGIAKVPFILGDQQDEGTLFGLFTSDIETPADIATYLRQYFFDNPAADVDALVALYPDAALDPNGPGSDDTFYAQFQRVATLLGDAVFTLTRRVVLSAIAAGDPDVPSWSYLASYDRGTPLLGTFHGSDLLQVFYGVRDNYAASATLAYFVNFAYNLDPNDGSGGTAPPSDAGAVPTLIEWPRWSEGKTLVEFGADSFSLLQDDFRPEVFEFLVANSSNLHF